MKIGRFLCGVLLALLGCTTAWSQTLSSSQVSGTITDQTGAVVANAQIKLTQTDTSESHVVKSNSSGSYIVPDLPGGPYRLEVTVPGFKMFVQTGIKLEVDTNPEINVKLTVGAVDQTVSIEANALMVETQSTSIGQVIDSTQVVALPLNGRDPDQLIALAGATTPYTAGTDTNSNKNFPTITLSVAGGMPTAIAFVLDGGSHNDPFNNLNMPQPFPDALQEFKVETSSLPAQYGDHSSAAINAVTKSGGNKFHGDAFEFIRNYAANAANFFNYVPATATTAASKPRDSLKRNQFGGVIGGPIIKDKLFFFGGYEGTISRQLPAASSTQVMTPAMLAGDFSQITAPVTAGGCQSSQILLGAPFTSVKNSSGTYTQTINPNLISSQALKALAFIPTATPALDVSSGHTVSGVQLPVGCGYVNVYVPANNSERLGVGRVDYVLSSKQSVFVRYLVGIYDAPIPATPTNALNENAISQHNNDQSLVLGDVYSFTQNLTNAAHFTEKRIVNTRVVDPFFDPSTLGINTYNAVKGYMALSISGGFGVGGGTTNPGHFNSTGEQFTDDVNYILGKHQLAAGIDYQYNLMDAEDFRPSNGEYSFTGNIVSYKTSTSAACVAALAAGTANGITCSPQSIGYADFVSGNLDSLTQGNTDYENDGQTYIGAYAQDSWKATRRLTLNYGLRWEPYLPEHNSNDHVENFNLADFQSGYISTKYPKAPAGMIFSGDPGMNGNHYNFGQKALFAPRFGMVFDPAGDGKSTIRAGYGMFYDGPQLYFNTRYSNAPPFGDQITQSGVLSFANPWATFAGGDPFPFSSPATTIFPPAGVYVNTPLHPKTMYMQQWNLAAQRQIGSWLFGGSYVGNTTKHMPASYEANPGVYSATATTANIATRRLLYNMNPTQGAYYATIGTLDPGGVANYNGALFSVQRRSSNLNIVANYTYAHCLSDAETTELTGPSYPQPPSFNPHGLQASYGNCDSQRRHVTNISLILHTPKLQQHLVDSVVGNWQWSTIFTATSGSYGSVTTSSDIALNGNGTQLAVITGNPYTGARTRFGSGNYLTAASFANPPAGTFSSTQPLGIVGPSSYELDTAISRTFKVPRLEGNTLNVRVEAFNVTNEAIFSGAATGSFNSSTFGSFTSAGSPRIMQAAVKYVF